MRWAAAVALALIARPTAAMDAEVRASDRTEARVLTWTDATPTYYEAQNDLVAELDLRTRSSAARLAYTPRFVLRDLSGDLGHEIFNAGLAELVWLHRRTKLTLHEDGGYGEASLTSLAFPVQVGPAGAPPVIQTQPFTLRYATTTSRIGVAYSATRLLSVSLDGAFTEGGGLDDASRTSLPFQRIGEATVGATVHLSRRDDFQSALSAAETTYSTGSRYLILTSKQGLSRLLTRRTTAGVTVGVAALFGRLSEDGPSVYRRYPVAEISTTTRSSPRPDHYELTVLARLSPEQNRTLGTVDRRGQAEARFTLDAGRWGLDVLAAAAASIPRDQSGGIEQLYLTAGVRRRLSRVVGVDGGVRVLFLRVTPLDPALASTTVGERIPYVGLTIATPDGRP